MKPFQMMLAAPVLFALGSVLAFAQEAVPNPTTGDNSMIAVALVVMGVAAVAVVAVLLSGKGKKKKNNKK